MRIRRLSVWLNYYCKRENVEGGRGGGGWTAVPSKKCPAWGDNIPREGHSILGTTVRGDNRA